MRSVRCSAAKSEFFEDFKIAFFYLFDRFQADQSGATAVEYALIAGGIALAIIVGVGLMGGSVESIMTEAGSGL